MKIKQWFVEMRDKQAYMMTLRNNPHSLDSGLALAFQWEYVIVPYYHYDWAKQNFAKSFCPETFQSHHAPLYTSYSHDMLRILFQRLYALRNENKWTIQQQQNSENAFDDLMVYLSHDSDFAPYIPLYRAMYSYVATHQLGTSSDWDALTNHIQYIDRFWNTMMDDFFIQDLGCPTLAKGCFWRVMIEEGIFPLESLQLWEEYYGFLAEEYPLFMEYTLWKEGPSILQQQHTTIAPHLLMEETVLHI